MNVKLPWRTEQKVRQVERRRRSCIHFTEMRMFRWAKGKATLNLKNVDFWKEPSMYPKREFPREQRLTTIKLWFGYV